MDDKTRTELEAAVYRRLVEHLRTRSDVQNIDMMNLAGFCRNCLSNWMKDAADAKGVAMSKDESREAIYGMPFDEWKAKYQNEASKAQLAAFSKSNPGKLKEAAFKKPLNVQYGSWAVQKGNSAFVKYLNTYLCKVQGNGSMAAIYKKTEGAAIPPMPKC